MGLDMYAGWLHPKPEQPDNVVDIKDNIGERMEGVYEWRKHARLQQFMMMLHDSKNNGPGQGERNGMMDSFNSGEVLMLTKDDVLMLKERVEKEDLPFCPDGFFWGHQFQEESVKEYKEQDLKFCEDALKWLDEGKEIWYECSW